MSPSILLINPRADFPTYYGAEVYEGRGFRPAAFLADLVLPTLAAMVPEDFHVKLCDEHLEAVDPDQDCDFVGITGKISQWGRMKALAAAFRERGRVVIIGGPHASLSPEVVRPHCDILVRGEIEEISAEFFADLRSGRWREEYVGGRPDLSLTPMPRWDLYSHYNDRVLTATVQTARGCPFECEFCDVIQYLGRRQRKKPVERIIAELDAVYAHGYRSVLLADDNTTASRAFVKELLERIAAWNRERVDGHISFSTQLSIDAARDDEVLELCARAGMTHVFIGVETPNEESLVEIKKHQNLRRNLRNPEQSEPSMVDQIHRFYRHGIGVTAGIICGFDHDGPEIFERQYAFAMTSAVPILTVGALVAPAGTPLHERLRSAGRLVDGSEVPGHPWNTNIVPAQMSREELERDILALIERLYHPRAFGERMLDMVEHLAPHPLAGTAAQRKRLRSVDADTLALIGAVKNLDREARLMWERVMAVLPRKPGVAVPLMEALVRYQQVRFMLESAPLPSC